MKKAIVLSVLGIAASGIAAFGQGNINFNNYGSTTYNTDQVLWGANSGHTAGTTVQTTAVDVQLFYALGNLTGDSQSTFLAAATAGLQGSVSLSFNGAGSYGVGPYGYYGVGNQIITGWSSGAVTFMVEAWDTTTGASYAAATVKGASALWTETGAASASANGIQPTSLAPTYFHNSVGVTLVGAVPEPTTMALGGLGLAALMLFRRKQA